MQQVIVGGNDGLLDNTSLAVKYNYVMGGIPWSATENTRYECIPTGGTITKLRVQLNAAPGVGTSYTFTLMLNGIATLLSCVIANADTVGSDLVNSVAVVAGDTVSLRCVTSLVSPATTPAAAWTSIFTGTNAGESISMCNTRGDGANTFYGEIEGGNEGTIEAQWLAPIPTPGTFKSLYVQLSASPGAAPRAYTVTLRLGAAPTALTVTITGPATSGNVIADVAVVSGNLVDIQIVPSATAPVALQAAVGMVFMATTDGESLIMGGNNIQPNPAGGTVFNNLCTGTSAWNAVESAIYSLIQACTLKRLYVHLQIAPGAGTNYALTVRVNGADAGAPAAMSVTIADANTDGNDVVNTAAPADGQTCGAKLIPTGPPAWTRVHWGLVGLTGGAPPASGKAFTSNASKLVAAGVI